MNAPSVKTNVKLRTAEIAYSKRSGRLELTVPNGTRLAELAKIFDRVTDKAILEKLPRGCLPCISGEPFDIRERFETVINVDLERGGIVG